MLRSEGVSVSFSRKIPALPFPADLGAHNESIFWVGVRAHTEGGKGTKGKFAKFQIRPDPLAR